MVSVRCICGFIARREFHDDEARAVRRRRGAENARAHVFDVLADGDIARASLSVHHIKVEATPSRGRLVLVAGAFEDDLGDVLAVVSGDDAADRLLGMGDFRILG